MNKEPERFKRERTVGILYALAAYGAWGILPLYWKALESVSAYEILAHRILWSFVFVGLMLLLLGRWSQFKNVVSSRSNLIAAFLCSLLISLNWGIYIWAVNADQIVEASLGYYINPLVNILLGMLVLKERLNFWQMISLFLAFAGVMNMTLHYGKFPWIAITLAVSFAFYGLTKKIANFDSLIGLALETLFLVPVSLIYLLYIHANGAGAFGSAPLYVTLLLLGAGAATALPLLWFAQGARRIPLSTMGFIQYLSPSISLMIGVFLFKEPFTAIHLISFSLIWFALVFFTLSQTHFFHRLQPKFFRSERTAEHQMR